MSRSSVGLHACLFEVTNSVNEVKLFTHNVDKKKEDDKRYNVSICTEKGRFHHFPLHFEFGKKLKDTELKCCFETLIKKIHELKLSLCNITEDDNKKFKLLFETYIGKVVNEDVFDTRNPDYVSTVRLPFTEETKYMKMQMETIYNEHPQKERIFKIFHSCSPHGDRGFGSNDFYDSRQTQKNPLLLFEEQINYEGIIEFVKDNIAPEVVYVFTKRPDPKNKLLQNSVELLKGKNPNEFIIFKFVSRNLHDKETLEKKFKCFLRDFEDHMNKEIPPEKTNEKAFDMESILSKSIGVPVHNHYFDEIDCTYHIKIPLTRFTKDMEDVMIYILENKVKIRRRFLPSFIHIDNPVHIPRSTFYNVTFPVATVKGVFATMITSPEGGENWLPRHLEKRDNYNKKLITPNFPREEIEYNTTPVFENYDNLE